MQEAEIPDHQRSSVQNGQKSRRELDIRYVDLPLASRSVRLFSAELAFARDIMRGRKKRSPRAKVS